MQQQPVQITVEQRAQQLLSQQVSTYAHQNSLLMAENEALRNHIAMLEEELKKHLPKGEDDTSTEENAGEVSEESTEATEEVQEDSEAPKKATRKRTKKSTKK